MREYFDVNYWVVFFTGSDARKRLTENFLSLSVLQGLNYLLPLVTLPYLVRVLGPEKFGLIAFAQAFVGYFQVITDYGFNLSATREISVYREDKERINEIFSSVMIVKVFLCLISFLILLFFLTFISKFRTDWLIYLFSFGMVLGNVLFPGWFFQGMERMKYITILNIITKLIFTLAIFVFIRKNSDFIYVPLINSFGYLVAGIFGTWITYKIFNIKILLPSLRAIKQEFKDGLYIFLGTIGINFYKNNSIIILGFFTNNTIVGYFVIAKKIVELLNSIAGVISQTIYPYISNQININYQKTIRFLKKVGITISVYTFILGVILLLFPQEIIYLISGQYYKDSILSLKLLAFVPMFIGVNVPAVQILLCRGFDKSFTQAVLFGAMLDIILNFSLVPFFSFVGSCISIIVVELCVTIFLYFKVFKIKQGEII